MNAEYPQVSSITPPPPIGLALAHQITEQQLQRSKVIVQAGRLAKLTLGTLQRNPQNPRTYFDPEAHKAMVLSVRTHHIMQSLLVREMPDGTIQIIAGERRYRAALEAFPIEELIPVLIVVCTDEEARILAIVENIQREDMSPTEEAEQAAKTLGACNGDRDEAARQLGWSRAVLESRLALMNCSEAVRIALTERRIKLGHAELFAALAKDKQDQLLPVIIAESKTVAELRKFVDQIGCKLDTAIFDKTECGACPHNSSLQSEMFSEAIAVGNCTNKACFTGKTERHLEQVRAGMLDEYPTVRVIRPGDNLTRIQLIAEGNKGVGEAQVKACHACQNFGAAVSALPDSLGKVYRGQCFDTACNARMVAARIRSEISSKENSVKPAVGPLTAKGSAKVPEKKEVAEQPVTSVRESDSVKTYRVALWRKALCREVSKDATLARRYLLAIGLTGYTNAIEGSQFAKICAKLLGDGVTVSLTDLGNNAALLSNVAGENHASMVTGMALAGIQGLQVHNLQQLCRHHKLDLALHWKLCKEFLELLTKSEMKFVADEIGLRQHLGEAFSKLFNKSKPDLIQALLNVEGFEYNGKLPAVLQF